MYLTRSIIATDPAVTERVRAAYADETGRDPVEWTYNNRYQWVGPDWDEAWEYAVAAGNPNIGSDPTVITDGMILAQIQLMLTPPTPPVEPTPL